MNTIIFKSWNLMRLLRIAIGVWAIISAFKTGEVVIGLMGGLLVVTAVMNIGCCGINGCSAKTIKNKKSIQKTDEITYEEVTQK